MIESEKHGIGRLILRASEAALAEAVNHPEHYGGDTTYEAIKVIEAWGLGFHDGNAVKYICRSGKKDPAKRLEDLKKARWYLNRLIWTLEQQDATGSGQRAPGAE